MTLTIKPDDPRLNWLGAVSLERTSEWVMPWRVNHVERRLFHETLAARASMPAGVRIAFRSNTTIVAGEVVGEKEASPIDLCINGSPHASQSLVEKDNFRFDGLSNEDKLIELWLPQFGEFRLRSLQLSGGATVEANLDKRPRWVTYGSSISQCRAAESPTNTWPSIVARERGLNLTCLGFGGQCHLDTLIARTICDLPTDFLSMCVGINIQGQSSMSERTFRSSIIGFIRLVREKHPSTPLAVISPICSPPRETTPNVVGFTLPKMRVEVTAAVRTLEAHGDRHIFYVDGLEVFGHEHANLLPDALHPSAEGYKVLAANFLRVVGPRLFGGQR